MMRRLLLELLGLWLIIVVLLLRLFYTSRLTMSQFDHGDNLQVSQNQLILANRPAVQTPPVYEPIAGHVYRPPVTVTETVTASPAPPAPPVTVTETVTLPPKPTTLNKSIGALSPAERLNLAFSGTAAFATVIIAICAIVTISKKQKLN
jgi:hypothetical protein